MRAMGFKFGAKITEEDVAYKSIYITGDGDYASFPDSAITFSTYSTSMLILAAL